MTDDEQASQAKAAATSAVQPVANDPPELSEGPTIEIQDAMVRPAPCSTSSRALDELTRMTSSSLLRTMMPTRLLVR
jgi:hypothetical protein